MQSSPTSESGARLARSLADPYAWIVAAVAAIATAFLGWSLGMVVVVFVLVLAARLAAEFAVPRGAQLELADSVAARQQQVQSALTNVERLALSGTPSEVSNRVRAICQTIREITTRTTTLAASSPQLFSVLRTATDYLPGAIEAYMRLPHGYATTRKLADGQTALGVLIGQLDLLEKEMVDVADAVTQNDINRLLAHGRFLNEKFGRSTLTLP